MFLDHHIASASNILNLRVLDLKLDDHIEISTESELPNPNLVVVKLPLGPAWAGSKDLQSAHSLANPFGNLEISR